MNIKEVLKRSAGRVSLCAMICAVGVVGRIGLTVIPNVQPVTALIMLTAIFIGLPEALLCSVVIVMVTNLIMGMGIWSLYQIAGWMLVAVATKLCMSWIKKLKSWLVYPISAAWAMLMGFGFGAFVSIFSYKTFAMGGAQQGYWAYWIGGLPFDLYHALGNAVFFTVLIPIFKKLFADVKQ
jgi:energy-coupling factor transport system substrate-specific component